VSRFGIELSDSFHLRVSAACLEIGKSTVSSFSKLNASQVEAFVRFLFWKDFATDLGKGGEQLSLEETWHRRDQINGKRLLVDAARTPSEACGSSRAAAIYCWPLKH
jgi:hypothetical protein